MPAAAPPPPSMSPIPRFQSLRVLFAMIMREMNTRYGRTWGGYVWAVIDPVGMILLLALAFSQFIPSPPLGESFVLFYATGYLPFHFYLEISNSTSGAVKFNKPLMQFPAVTPLDAVIARFILSVLTLIVVNAVVLSGIAILIGWPRGIDPAWVLIALCVAAVLGLGLGTLNCVLFAFFPVWARIWAVINRPLFLISGVFYTFESMPSDIQAMLWYNPLVHVVGLMRRGFYPTYNADFVSISFVLGLALGCLILGAYLLIRHRSFVAQN